MICLSDDGSPHGPSTAQTSDRSGYGQEPSLLISLAGEMKRC